MLPTRRALAARRDAAAKCETGRGNDGGGEGLLCMGCFHSPDVAHGLNVDADAAVTHGGGLDWEARRREL